MPEISIIVPVYKAEQYLPQCIESILAQTFTDFELILVDDGSPDACGAICDEYAKKDARIKVIHQPNSGVSVARNAALDIASGKYIMFCDSDDWVEPEWCECLHNAIQTPNVVMAVCGYKVWECERLVRVATFGDSNNAIKLCRIFDNPVSNPPWNKIYIRNQINKYNIRFSIDVSFGEDVRFVLEYMSTFISENEVFFYSYALNNYRLVDDSLSHKYIKDFWKLEKELIELRLEVAKVHNTDLEEYNERVNYYYFKLIFNSIDNIFKTKNNLSFLQKYKEFKQIVRSDEFEKMKKSKAYGTPPIWYRLLLKRPMLPLLYLYYKYKSNK